MSAAAGCECPVKSKKKLHFCNKRCSFIRALPLAKKAASLIEEETFKKRITNIEQGIMNIEVRHSIDLY